jgi:hypothetical protein
MERMKNMRPHQKSERIAWMVWPFVIAAFVMGAAIFIDALSIDDTNDAAENAHYGGPPADVIQLSADSYLIAQGSNVAPLDICKGENSNGEALEDAPRPIEKLKATYLECGDDQNWNARDEAINYSLGEGLQQASTKSWVFPVGAVAAFLTLAFPLLVGFREGFGAIGDRRRAKRERSVKYDANLARYRAIQDSYARGQIDDLEFDKRISKLVGDGFTLPDKGIFTKS